MNVPIASRLPSGVIRPTILVLVTATCAVVGLTFTSWMNVDLEDSWALVPDRVPDALLLAVDRGLTPYELAGVGFVLSILCALAAVSFTYAVARRRWNWLLVSSSLFAFAGALGAIVTILLVLAKSLVEVVLPPSWDEFDPEVNVAGYPYLFIVLCFGLSLSILALRARMRRGPKT